MAQNDEFLTALKTVNPIESVIDSYVQLKKSGRVFMCNCPFHSEKTPSFTVFPDTQSFYCFGCQTGGDVFNFIMKAENLEFMEAVRLLADRSGMEVPEKNNQGSEKAKLRTRIYEINRLTANFFYLNLIKGRNKAGLQYFQNRYLTPQTIKKYGLGYASDSWDELCRMLTSKGYSEYEITQAWLGGTSQKTGRLFDLFRNRVMFPIVDLRGNVIGFGGRVLDDSKPKYLNTGATPVFDKGSNLFSMNFAKNSPSKQIILCEGYMDVIAVNQAGFENAVATLGTAITPNQARLLSHYAEEVIIAYDSDAAGQSATRKAISHFTDVGIQTRILRMEGAKDPDEYIKKFGAQRFRMLIEKSRDANNFLLDRCENDLDINTESGKVELLKRVSNVLAGIPSALEREVYISRTAGKYDFPVDVLKLHIDDILRKNKNTERKKENRSIYTQTIMARDEINPEAETFKKEAKAEEEIIAFLMRFPEEAEQISEKAPADIFITPFNKRVYSAILSNTAEHGEFSITLLNSEFSADEISRISGIAAKKQDMTFMQKSLDDCAQVLRNHLEIPKDGIISDEALANILKKKVNK